MHKDIYSDVMGQVCDARRKYSGSAHKLNLVSVPMVKQLKKSSSKKLALVGKHRCHQCNAGIT